MRESIIETKVCEFAEKQGWLVRKIVYAGRRGCPDRMFVRNGKILLVEFKRPGGGPDPLQVKEHARLKERGVTVHLIDDIAAGCALLT